MRSGKYLLLLTLSLMLQFQAQATVPDTAEPPVWLRDAIIPLRSTELHSDPADIQPLGDIVGKARVVALGEVTHGSSEIYRLKSKMVKYLVEHKGFTVFVLEAAMPEAYKMNEYINGGKGDPALLLKNMHFPIWETQEMLDLILWMKDYNDRHHKKIIFTGMDMQFNEGAFDEIKRLYNIYNKTPDTLLDSLHGRLLTLNEYRNKNYKSLIKFHPAANTVLKDCAQLRVFAKNRITNIQNQLWFLQNVNIIEQCTHNFATSTADHFRDSCMAANVMWTYKNYPQAKFMLWAHNAHIQKAPTADDYHRMGAYIHEMLQQDYFSVGFALYQGSFTSGGRSLHPQAMVTAPRGSWEFLFHRTGQRLFLLDTQLIPTAGPNDQNFSYRPFRATGDRERGNEFYFFDLKRNFDALVFIDSSSPSRLLP